MGNTNEMSTTFTLIIQATKNVVLVQLGIAAILVLVVAVVGIVIRRRVQRGRQLEAQLTRLEQHFEDADPRISEELVLKD